MEKDTVCSVGANYAEQIDELRLVCLNAPLITTPSPCIMPVRWKGPTSGPQPGVRTVSEHSLHIQ
jgi:hypothetical protein